MIETFETGGNEGGWTYLVVPLGSTVEGSYGLDSAEEERLAGLGATCRPSQSSACP